MSQGKCALGPEVKRRGLPPPARLFLCNAVVMLGESARQIKGGTVELVGSPGGGGSPATATLVTILAANSKSGHLGRKWIFFPLSALLFWLLFFLFLNPRSSPRRCPSDCVCRQPQCGVALAPVGTRGACKWNSPGASLLHLGSASAVTPVSVSRSCL